VTDKTANYPDVYAHITSTPRLNMGVAQVALATRPRIVRAGRPFEVIMLIQNAADVAVDVTVKLHIPEKDAAGQKGKIIAGAERLVVGINPAEVGYVTLPLATMPDTAVGDDYIIGMELNVKPLERPQRVRLPEGGGNFDPRQVSREAREQLEQLKALKFSTQKRGLLRSSILETRFSILEGKLGTPLELKPGWVSLWTLDNQDDIELLLDKYMDVLWRRVLPVLKRDRLYEPLLARTVERFEKAGYPLSEVEASALAKLLTLVVEFGGAGEQSAQVGPAAGEYDIYALIKNRRTRAGSTHVKLFEDEEPSPANLPRWCKAFLRALARDDRVARVPTKAIPYFAYDDLVHDALMFSFRIIERDVGEDLGNEEEMQNYAEMVVQKLGKLGELGFSYVYMPLMLGAVLMADQSLVGDERLVDVMKALREIVDAREDEHIDDNDDVFDMAHRVVNLTMRKYGLLDNR
jgi:hypothetical protein